jgi:hypothetical protein
VGSQPGSKSRRIFTPRPLFIMKGPAGKNAEYKKKKEKNESVLLTGSGS